MLTVHRLHVGLVSADPSFTLNPEEAKAKAIALTSEVFQGFNVADTQGYWEGKAEPSVIIAIGIEPIDRQKVLDLARNLCANLKQQCIGWERNGFMDFVS